MCVCMYECMCVRARARIYACMHVCVCMNDVRCSMQCIIIKHLLARASDHPSYCNANIWNVVCCCMFKIRIRWLVRILNKYHTLVFGMANPVGTYIFRLVDEFQDLILTKDIWMQNSYGLRKHGISWFPWFCKYFNDQCSSAWQSCVHPGGSRRRMHYRLSLKYVFWW